MCRLHFTLLNALRLIACFLMLALAPHFAHASQWLAIKKTDVTQLMIDKQSLIEEKPYLKAWIKVEYQTPQKNIESVDRLYNNAKALWYFDCEKRKAATIQVFQYEQSELVYSAGTTVKQADFIEPLPDSEVEIAQSYACQWQAKQKQRLEAAAQRAAMASRQANSEVAIVPAVNNTGANVAAAPPKASDQPTSNKAAPAAAPNGAGKNKATPNSNATDKKATDKKTEVKKAEDKKTEDKKVEDKKAEDKKTEDKKAEEKKDKKGDQKTWSYEGEQGPKHWAGLDPSFATCEKGRQQSPIDIDKTIPAGLKPLKRLQKFPLKSISHQAHALAMDAGSGNMMVLDQQPYQLKQLVLHMPAEHRLKQKSFHAELQFLHEDKTGHRVIIAVMIEEGSAHPAIDKILGQLPKPNEKSKALTLRITPEELMPNKAAYYRYSGSMTTPPCDEGVQWVVMKEALKLSKAQLSQLQEALAGPNQRPLQDAQGRMVLE